MYDRRTPLQYSSEANANQFLNIGVFRGFSYQANKILLLFAYPMTIFAIKRIYQEFQTLDGAEGKYFEIRLSILLQMAFAKDFGYTIVL